MGRMNAEAEKRLATERRVVRTLIRTLKGEGWGVSAVFDGEDTVRWDGKGPTETQVMEAVFSVDMSTIWFWHNEKGRKHGVWIVLGNGEDAIADYGVSPNDSDGFGAAVDRVISKVQGWE